MKLAVAIVLVGATACFILPERHPTDRTGDAAGGDDGNGSGSGSGVHANIVFVTAATFRIPGGSTGTANGSGTLMAADSLCQQSAFDAPPTSPVRGHYFIAWMSADPMNARDRLAGTMARAWKRMDDAPIAATLTDLTSGMLLDAIRFDENGQVIDALINVMTGTTPSGFYDAGQDGGCSQGRIGTGHATDMDMRWTSGDHVSCGDVSSRIYCVGDDIMDGSL